MKGFRAALGFLTLLPAGGGSLEGALAWFPLAGLLLGAAAAGAWLLAAWAWGSPLLAGLAAVAAGTVLSGALHLDGLADTCDAACSWRSRERKLEIMRDSRIGTMGALGLAFDLLARVGALTALGSWAPWGVLLAPVWGRWSALYALVWFPPARPDGLGRAFREAGRRRDFPLATATALLAGGLLLPPWGVAAGLAAWIPVHLAARSLARDLGGQTGDTCGALSETAEVAFLLILTGLVHHGWL